LPGKRISKTESGSRGKILKNGRDMGMVLTKKPRRGAADFERSEKSFRGLRGKLPLTSGAMPGFEE
jgi:hypothetical protein